MSAAVAAMGHHSTGRRGSEDEDENKGEPGIFFSFQHPHTPLLLDAMPWTPCHIPLLLDAMPCPLFLPCCSSPLYISTDAAGPHVFRVCVCVCVYELPGFTQAGDVCE